VRVFAISIFAFDIPAVGACEEFVLSYDYGISKTLRKRVGRDLKLPDDFFRFEWLACGGAVDIIKMSTARKQSLRGDEFPPEKFFSEFRPERA
jgi:hypothetical protein